jgi:UDP-N-acetylmuramoylalanine--D-glutamate ligase
MSRTESLAGRRVTVAGLGHFGGGIAVAKWLVQQGATVLVTDKAPPEKLADSVAQLEGLPITYRLGGHDERDFTGADLVVTSPAVPPTNPYLLAAAAANVPITTEIKLFVERCPTKKVLAVTGTKGKSTTTALLHRMLQTVGRAWLGGNIGVSLLEKLAEIRDDDFVVLELSSFMLHWLGQDRWSPHVAVVTMVTADHLDWHGTVEAYVQAKRNIVRFQSEQDYAVLRHDDKVSRGFADDTPAQKLIYGKRAHLPETLAPLLPGKHNRLNERGAWTAARIFGVYPDMAQEALQDFRGLPHRLELVHEQDGVKWVNDSIATIPAAAVVALEAFAAKKVIQIVGGVDKKLGFDAMASALAERAKAVLTIGEAGPTIAAMCRDATVRGKRAEIVECGDLPAAIARARSLAADGDVVLLSTGCSSYDQFTNFEERGLRFAELARG